MGTWGVGVFSNDDALDIRGDFRDLIAVGYSAEDATSVLIESMTTGEHDALEGEHWIALAMTQWRLGRLAEAVREHALAAIAAEIEDGHSVWDEKDRRPRARALSKVRDTLLSPQREPPKVRAERRARTPFAPGDIVRYTCSNGREVAMWATENKRHEGVAPELVDVDTAFELIALGDPELPPVDELVRRDPVVIESADGGYRSHSTFFLRLPQDARGEQWQVIGNVAYPRKPLSRFGNGPPDVRSRASSSRGTLDAFFTNLQDAGPSTSPRGRPLQQIIDAVPTAGSRSAWVGNRHQKAHELATRIVAMLDAGDRAAVQPPMTVIDELAGGDRFERATAIRILDVLLCNASYPEVSFAAADVRSLVGARGLAVIDDIDAAWNGLPTSPPPTFAADPLGLFGPEDARAYNRHVSETEHIVSWRPPGDRAEQLDETPIARLCDD
jgi:hypothetical protein